MLILFFRRSLICDDRRILLLRLLLQLHGRLEWREEASARLHEARRRQQTLRGARLQHQRQASLTRLRRRQLRLLQLIRLAALVWRRCRRTAVRLTHILTAAHHTSAAHVAASHSAAAHQPLSRGKLSQTALQQQTALSATV